MKLTSDNPRVKALNDQATREGQYILYWMQQSQREEDNHALEWACQRAQELDCAVLVLFTLMDDYPEANLRHYCFMLEGLNETQQDLLARDIKMLVIKKEPLPGVLEYADKAREVVCDRGYLRHQRQWRTEMARQLDRKLWQVESDVVVPVEEASPKEEYAARTIRPKLQSTLRDYWDRPERVSPGRSSKHFPYQGLDLTSPEKLAGELKIDHSVEPVSQYFKGGRKAAHQHWQDFLANAYPQYSSNRNQPHRDDVSHMSPYLHFGQISPLFLLDDMKQRRGENRDDYIEELVVRRELAVNFCYYNDDYDRMACLPDWARETLKDHKQDERPRVYTAEELEAGQTDDPYWNAAMAMMKERGYLHNHMRMYWGKQILQYCNTPQYAYKVALMLNNKYFLDGRDCNSYANIAWLFGKHDRGWTEREIYGKVRIMTKGGLERKIDTEAWLEKLPKLRKDNS